MLLRIKALIKKDFHQIFRDTRTLAVLLLLPMFLLGIFGYAVNFDVKKIQTAIYDQDNSSESRNLLLMLQAYDYFNLITNVHSLSEIDFLINREKIQAAIVIPNHFGSTLRRGNKASLQFIVDGVNGNAGITASAYFIQIVSNYSQNIMVKIARQYGLTPKTPIKIHERIWYNPELKSSNFLVPGLIAFILMITAVISTSLSVVREKELNTIEQIVVSPVSAVELMIGKTLPTMVIALFSGFLIIVASYVFFGITIKGNLFTLFAASVIFLLGGLGQGLVISTLADTQAIAFMIVIVVSMLPTLLLSGFIFKISSMPIALQIFSYLIPARYFLVILRGVILKGTSFTLYAEQFFFLTLFFILMLLISSVRMIKHL